MPGKITKEQVEAAVRRYWKVFTSKSFADFSRIYTSEALVFGAFDRRPQLGRLAAARVEREYGNAESSFQIDYLSPIEVQVLSDTVAVAVYLLRWEARNLAQSVLGKTVNKLVPEGRVTTVFILDENDNLSIAHHHFSSVCRLSAEEGRLDPKA